LEANPGALTVEGELDEDVILHSDDPEMQEVESRLKKGEDIEDILASWEDEATQEFWRRRGEKVRTKEVAPPAALPEDEFADEYIPEKPLPGPVKLT
jgi:hypothetical protein